MQTLTLVLVGLFFAWMLYIGWRTHLARSKTEERENFLIGNRNVPAWLVAIGTTMGWVDAFQFGVNPQLGYEMGWSFLWFVGLIPVGFLIMGYFAPRIRDEGARVGAYMLGNYFSRFLSPRCSALIGLCVAVMTFTWMLLQVGLGVQILQKMAGIPPVWGMLGMGGITLAYMLMGGLMASLKTDLAQAFIVLIFCVILAALVLPQFPVWAPPASTFIPSDSGMTTVLMVFAISSILGGPDIWQRIYSASSAAEARRSMFACAWTLGLVLLFFCFLGMAAKGLNLTADSSQAGPAVLMQLIPGWLQPLGVLAIMAALMSTLSTTLFACAMALASDVGRELGWLDKSRLTPTSRVLMCVLMPLGLLISFQAPALLDIAFTCMAVTLVYTPHLVGVLMGIKITERASFWSLLLSLVVFAVGVCLNVMTGPLALLPLIVATGTLLVFEGLLASKARKK